VIALKGLVIAGYGGHAGYAFAMAYELARRGVELDVLLPKGYEHLSSKFTGLGRTRYAVLPRKPLEPFYRGIHRWLLAFSSTLRLVKENYDFVFAAGSNFSIPASTWLKTLRNIPVYVVEDVNRFSRPAKAVGLLHMLGARVLLHWREQRELYRDGVVVGPLYEPVLSKPSDMGYLLVTLGTLGSKEVFEAVTNLNYKIAVVQTGDIDPRAYAVRRPDWVFFKYVDDFHRWIAGASIVVTHPGTTAVTARLAYGKPVVLVYTKRHSPLYPKKDVEMLAKMLKAAFIDEVTPENLEAAIQEAMRLEKPVYENGARNASDLILKECFKNAETRRS
jgi:UDP-N-acetylglucosamine:LPS N-acetylglucosamine transferase